MRFAMALSEACQNIVEHAGTGGWVAVQAYTFRRRLGRRVVVIAVSDAGIGFRRSLESSACQALRRPLGRRRGARGRADPGREPLPRSRAAGRVSPASSAISTGGRARSRIRSGTARLAIVPPWDDDVPLGRASSLLSRSPSADHHPRAGRRDPMIQTIRHRPHCCARRSPHRTATSSPAPPAPPSAAGSRRRSPARTA